MTQEHTINTIRAALRQMSAGDLTEAATHFLAALGYRSDRLLDGQTGTVDYFIANFKADNTDTRSEQDFRDSVREARILFQYTESEITETGQRMLLEAGGFSEGNSRSFIFAAVELNGSSYPRGRYAAFTREINKRFNRVPAAVLFRTSNGKVTLAFVNRRPSKIRDDRQVLGSVSLIREIDPANPHRAHLDILAELSLPERLKWMDGHGQPHNFDGLLAAWLAALDTEELNKKFYRELFTWFERAVHTAKFPDQEKVTLTAEEHVIRLITRLMFVWFIKEKGLVAEDLFVENQVSQLLKDYDPDGGDSYYRAVLQNLFFATLNTEIGDRRFSTKTRDDHRNFSVYRYRNEIADSARLLKLFGQTPFINGGLFDCLDSFDGVRAGGVRVDCFTDIPKQRAGHSIPNRLFFSQDQASPGLIDLFDSYKFTVEENTPAEREVALDPELLGKVFENLLAAFNPETRENVRKQTGSYYTPRPVVDYMVDEALAATLAQKVAAQPDDLSPSFPRKPESTSDSPSFPRKPASPADSPSFPRRPESTSDSPSFPRKPESTSDSPSFPRKPESISDRLRSLLDYDLADADTLFTPAEKTAIVRAIAETRALDPAVGSGAFPMGILHKLTLALRRLDPGNQLWRELQREIATKRAADAFGTDDSTARERELEEISRTFDQYRDSDFGRKLYLIQNGIYGVDLQPVATQIAKLRFFISLAIEQQPNADPADNYGIRPLPNLETRFVAADTLLALGGLNRELVSPQTEDLQRQLNANRERHFHANTRSLKLRYRNQDRELRHQLADSLAASGLDADHAARVAAWDPYDQNAHADWFDPQYMFGVSDGFDVVIANPPYINVENLTSETRAYLFANFQACAGRTDIYVAFLEKALSLLNEAGLMSFIIPAAFTKQQYATTLRRMLINNHHIRELVDASSYRIFDNAVVYNIVLLVDKRKSETPTRVRVHQSNDDFDNRTGVEFTIDQQFFLSLKDARLDSKPPDETAIGIREKAWRKSIRFDEICLVAYGARLNHRSKKIGKSHYISQARMAGGKAFCEGSNIERYTFAQEGWLKYSPKEHYNPMFPELFENEKIMFINVVKDHLRFAYDNSGIYNSHTVINCVRLDKLVGASHRTATNAVKQGNIEIAQQFNYKYLLAVLNSTCINWYFRTFLSENLHFYPNDAKELPIPKISAAEQEPYIALVDEILAAKEANPQADTRPLEREIDRLVYQLYGLTEEENTAIERSLGLIHQTDEAEDAAFLKILEESQTEERVSREEVMGE